MLGNPLLGLLNRLRGGLIWQWCRLGLGLWRLGLPVGVLLRIYHGLLLPGMSLLQGHLLLPIPDGRSLRLW